MKRRSPISKYVWWIHRRFIFNFRFEFEYRIHRTIKGDAFEWILAYLNASYEITFLREITHKNSLSTCFCTRSDDPATQCPAVLRKSGWSGLEPDHPDLVTFERPEWGQAGWSGPTPDDPDLGISVCVLPILSRPRMIRGYPGWSG